MNWLQVQNGATSCKSFYGIGYLDECGEAIKNPPPWDVWLTSISAWPCKKIHFNFCIFYIVLHALPMMY